jgi:hypothetical protein
MTTMTYEERLLAFAEGKRLRRFRGMLRMPRDTTCDACGSALPNYLYGLRDMEARRDYFVGANCFARLSQMLVLERPFVRANITSAYLAARGIPEEVASPHQPRLDDPCHPCCIHGRNGDGHGEA